MMKNEETGVSVPVAITVAISRKRRAIGKNNELLWHIPDDLKRFKEKTLGCPIIMGRKTFESILAILGKPLPGRTNVVLTRQADYAPAGAVVVATLEEGLALAAKESPREIHIGGGAEVYRLSLPYVDRLYVTYIDDEPEADAFFPEFTDAFETVHEEPPREQEGITYQFVDLERKV